MQITLSPIRSDALLTLYLSGEVLTINGADLDLSVIPEGATLPAAAVEYPWLAGDISRERGVLHLALLLPHGALPWPAPPETVVVTRPDPITVATDGPIILPAWLPGATLQ